jgi:excisionase family DNA binding protein
VRSRRRHAGGAQGDALAGFRCLSLSRCFSVFMTENVLAPTYRLLKADEVAGILNVTERTARRWAESGVIPSIRLGRTVRFRPEDVAALLDDPPHRPFPARPSELDYR